ncbi:D-alanyl-D-alanine carboxypeptidase/D-alanyl-D-alanine endopeptidase [Streptomyces hesseae]|uniref:D-alanyl-D-alanine carboxypeptidase/D-alanyl-D-alanine endopeptidase n=1 Tax=Streptomyces hesseae TaxID=3075519 RepID=UPI00288B669A|nr:D-alanyl-D-alanine carboxypeptidase/D-alanyl-D-alanine-endopeptidase [Streptomyces sp. DSM 40473]
MVPQAGRRQVGWWRDASREQRRTVRFAAVSAVAGLALATGAVTAAGPWDGGQRKAERDLAAAPARPGGARHADGERAPGAAPPVLAPVHSGGKRSADGLAEALEPLLKDSALGSDHAAAVVDATTGERLYGVGQSDAYTPASTIKLATAAATLSAVGPERRIETTVVAAGGDGVVLVGGGDPTLTPAGLGDLADATARALKARGTTGKVKLAYDVSRYSGPVLHTMGLNDNIAPVSPLMVNEGRLDDSDRGPADRTAEPAADAARKFAELLRDKGVDVDGEPGEGRAEGKAARLASVASPPVSALVERMLTNSDNDIAEALARQTALASGKPASFEGAAQAVTERLGALGLPMSAVHIADGSGLDRADRASAEFLALVLARAAEPGRPALRPVLTGLPVAGFSGTLRDRYPRDAAGRALVRAKTGTLTGVNTLAGTVVTPGGRLLAFAFLASGTTDADAAQKALDRAASALAGSAPPGS